MSDDGKTRERGRIVDLDDSTRPDRRTAHVLRANEEDPFDGPLPGTSPRDDALPTLGTPPTYASGIALLTSGALLTTAPAVSGIVVPELQFQGPGAFLMSALFLGGILLMSRGLHLLKSAADHV